MTFEELAVARGISRASASRLVRRRKWRRQTDNSGRVQILVPPEDNERPDNPMDAVRSLALLFREEVDRERTRADRAEARADQERSRADAVQLELLRAKEEAEELRRVEAIRRGLGRLARLRAAWRGE